MVCFVGLFSWLVWLSQMWPLCVAQARLELSVWVRVSLDLKVFSHLSLPSDGVIGIQLPS